MFIGAAQASLLIGGLILPRTWKLVRETVDVLLEATPKGVDLAEVRSHLLDVDDVHAVHDLHASTVASDLPVLIAHVVVDDSCFYDGHVPRVLDELQSCLGGHFDVEHSTFQFEPTSHADHEHAACLRLVRLHHPSLHHNQFGDSMTTPGPAVPDVRSGAARKAVGYEWFTIGYNLIEGIIAVSAGIVAGAV